ncbi:MAG: methylmalonyl-CoA mutase [Planctomycetota bacterium]|nr:MAG: methylmalonyl-CoA mutase [Planctomycetota bacterium]
MSQDFDTKPDTVSHLPPKPYSAKNKIRIVTGASLFDGHDAAINIMRRILQSSGAEVIHLGHNRSVHEFVKAAVEEDVQAVAVTSYQGGHMEFFQYMYDLLQKEAEGKIKIFGGGGGTILPQEIKELEEYGIGKIYSPEDGRKMGLQGMINHLLENSDFPTIQDVPENWQDGLSHQNSRTIAQLLSLLENYPDKGQIILKDLNISKNIPVLGITGTGGAGKSSLTDELVRRFLQDFPDKKVGILSVDPSKKKTGGALLGDRIRMNSIYNPRVYMRSFATRKANLSMSDTIQPSVKLLKAAGFDLIIVETAGIGQSDTHITEVADLALYVMTPEYGAATQLEKIDMIDFADIICLNKFDKEGAEDSLRDVKKQYQRSHHLFHKPWDEMPVYGTIASQFGDPGVNRLYKVLIDKLAEKKGLDWKSHFEITQAMSQKTYLIPPHRTRYLAEIVEDHEKYKDFTEEQSQIARKLYQCKGMMEELEKRGQDITSLKEFYEEWEKKLHPDVKNILDSWEDLKKAYRDEKFCYQVRQKTIEVENFTETLSHTKIPKIGLPPFQDWGEIVRWALKENFPGHFPFTAGVFPFKRTGEDPTRMFAGEGGPERTNKRFHYLSLDMPAHRLSTAFDSVTLYGEDPDYRPDIYGKVGNSGVSIATLDDAKKLYSGFDLCNPKTSVSMTINGPAPTILAFFMNTAIDQECEKYIRQMSMVEEVEKRIDEIYRAKGVPRPHYHGELPLGHNGLGLLLLGVTGDEVLPKEVYEKIKSQALSTVRGTVQADILKEDQAQNTCIFSTEFALRMMGDVQQYFIDHQVKNFYSVSISGYHIAEAGANPITQLAFTLANGFTYVEYYLSRGMQIDDFAPNFSYFFSNGMDAEYSVIGRVARRIWAKAMKNKYGASKRSQMLKYHIQTSGRSLHAQEIDFNDIRTTLQALYAIYDNCNSLHTNAYDEAITTPTEESVRRALAIQLIINKELGLAKNENPLQGSFIIEELTDLVEEAVMMEFKRISERGGVLGAMERMYQRNKIQEESLYYESLKLSGQLPIIGVNTFLPKNKEDLLEVPGEVIRATKEEKERQISNLQAFHKRNQEAAPKALKKLQKKALEHGNLFEELMETVKVASLGQITHALYEVGGQYRRNM